MGFIRWYGKGFAKPVYRSFAFWIGLALGVLMAIGIASQESERPIWLVVGLVVVSLVLGIAVGRLYSQIAQKFVEGYRGQ